MSASEVSEFPGTDDLPEARYLDREESWLRFNQPVLVAHAAKRSAPVEQPSQAG
jgi:polyphosphate kinase